MNEHPFLSKLTFCEALRLIKQQSEIDCKFSKALQEMGNGYFAFGCENKYLDALLLVLREAMDDKCEYISWWLYDTDDYTVTADGGNKVWHLEEPEALYDFLMDDCE